MTRRAHSAARNAGFSLVELLVSAAIMGVLASVAMPLVEISVRRQKEHDLRIALQEIRRGIDAYKAASASGQIAVEQGQSGYPPTLGHLAAGVANVQHPGASPLYFLRRIPRDPFYADKTKPAIKTWALRSFDSSPERPRPGSDVFDVYSTSTQTGLNGVPYVEW
jgi:general secretion pathway protein G